MDFHKISVASLTKIQVWLEPENNAKGNLYKNLHVLLQVPWDFLFGTRSLTCALAFFCCIKSLTQALSLLLLY